MSTFGILHTVNIFENVAPLLRSPMVFESGSDTGMPRLRAAALRTLGRFSIVKHTIPNVSLNWTGWNPALQFRR